MGLSVRPEDPEPVLLFSMTNSEAAPNVNVRRMHLSKTGLASERCSLGTSR